jgi:predicted acylesterase/phospholipase RssA
MILLLAALLASTPAAPRGRVALTLSGGVSLGSYEAGLTWAIMRYLRALPAGPELAAVAGASAGGINALLAAGLWCRERSDGRDEDADVNLFHDLWASVGLEDLLPDDPSAYAPNDGIFAAAPLESAFRRARAGVLAPGIRFRPGCVVPIGLTVTRERPEERTIAGLPVSRQRFVLPWRFEVDGSGAARIVSAPLDSGRESGDAQLVLGEPRGLRGIGLVQVSQAALASGAFPFAFRPRQLCDCALHCPEEDVVSNGTCEGPHPDQGITGLSCEAMQPAGSRHLCAHLYVDGGIFDNAPIGLAVDLAEASAAPGLPFNPTVYIFIDPDHRRLAPAVRAPPKRELVSPAEFFSNLIGTARETELARAVRDERWQRTTQGTISEFAQLEADVAAVQEDMARVAGTSDNAPAASPDELLRWPRREGLASFLSRCLDRLGRAAERASDPAMDEFADCAGPLRNGTAGAGERRDRPSSAGIVRLASALAYAFVAGSKTANSVLAEVTDPRTPIDRQLRLLAVIHDVTTIATVSYRFLVGELPAIATSDLDGRELVELRGHLLTAAREGNRVLRGTSAMLRVLLLAVLLEEQMEGKLPATAGDARAALAAAQDPDYEAPALREMATASARIGRLVALAPRLQSLSARASAIANDAAQLSSTGAPERRLLLSRRFSPLGGGALLNFSGFIDRPLRDLDFYAGVYDAVVQLATHDCEVQGPYPAGGRPAPVFRAAAPLEVDPSAEETQRCLGFAARSVVETLSLRGSLRASFVFIQLARLEVAAQLGDRAAAARLFAEGAWSWLGEPALAPGDQLGAAFAAVTSLKAPCRDGATEPLCLADPGLEELLDALQRFGYVPSSGAMREALSDRSRWMARFAGRLLDRAAAAEIASSERARRAPSDMVLTAVRLGEIWARRTQLLSGASGFDIDTSSIPPRSVANARPVLLVAAHALPYRVSLDFVRGGAGFSWLEPAFGATPWFAIESIADLLAIDGAARVETRLGLIPTLRLHGLAIGAGFEAALPWNGDPVLAPGPIGRLSFLQERLAVSIGARSLASGHRQVTAAVSLADLNGLVYWLTLWAAGRK